MITANYTSKLRTSQHEQGFTIVELMIALSVMAVVLVISTVVLINLGLLFTKGTNQAKTQNTTRNITNELASQLEIGNANPLVPGGNVICFGSQRYTFQLNHELTNSSTDHVLWRDTMSNNATCIPLRLSAAVPFDGLTVAGSGSELVLPNMELTDFAVAVPPATPVGVYSIKVTVAYGDPTQLVIARGKTSCLGGPGTQYCAVSSLTQNVARRSIN